MNALGHYSLAVVGVNHHHAPIEALERATLSNEQVVNAKRDLYQAPSLLTGFVLSTCNRVEFCGFGKDPAIANHLKDIFLRSCGKHAAQLETHLFVKEGRQALNHLFSVSSSLDSLVPGEAQILGQVKEVYAELLADKRSHAHFDRIMRKAISVAKRVRSETAIARQPVSIASVAIDLAGRIFEDLAKSRVLLLGSGEMGMAVAQCLQSRGIAELIVANRSHQSALELAERFDATVIAFDKREHYLEQVDIAITATGSRDYLLHRDFVAGLMQRRNQRPLFLVDISMPRNIDPLAHQIDNVYLYNLEDLATLVNENMEHRRQEVVKAQTLVEHEVERFVVSFTERLTAEKFVKEGRQ